MSNKFNFWVVLPDSYKNFPHIPIEMQAVCDLVVKALHGKNAMSRKQIFKACKKRKKDVTNGLRHLLRLKIISRKGKGVKNSPYLYSFK